MKIEHRFVDCIPESIESGVLYISIVYVTAMHLCVCGCGKEVVTPFSPTDWKLLFDGETVSLTPSIGNWSFPCRSHYFIKKNGVEWAGNMSQKLIESNREYDRHLKVQQYAKFEAPSVNVKTSINSENKTTKKLGIYEMVKSFFKQ
jgi:hypothetical protein